MTGRGTLKHVIIAENDKGGSGKTTAAETLATGFLAASKKVVVLDADGGNHGFIRRSGTGSAIPIGWHSDAAAAEDFIADHLTGAEIVVIDLGANFRASGAKVLNFVAELLFLAMNGGATILRCGVASPNAAGTDVLMQAITAGLGKIADTVIIENDVDGSGSFAAGLAENPTRRVRMGYIAPGLMELRLRRVEPLIAVLESPSPRYHCATAWLARHVLDVVSQPPFAEMVGEVGLARLNILARDAPGPLRFTVPSVKLVRDDLLRANEAALAAVRGLAICSEPNAWSAVLAYRNAEAAFRAAKLTP